MKNLILIFLGLISVVTVFAQDGQSAFGFLRLPASSYIAALGGTNISVINQESSSSFQNPALLSRSADKQLSLNYMNYVSDINVGSAMFSRTASARANWAVGMIYSDYGSFKETSETNEVLGDFAAKDMALHGIYSYKLTDEWAAGITGKAIYSAFADYTSFALGVDLGLNYYNEEKLFSFGLALKNLGGQLKKYSDEYENLPWDLQLGVSKKFAHAPFRFHTTLRYLTVWDMSLHRSSTTSTTTTAYTGGSDSFLKTLAKHCVFGVDILLSENFYLATSYNPKTADDFKVAEKKGMYGFTLGAGVKIKRMQVGASVFQQHIKGTTLLISLTKTLGK